MDFDSFAKTIQTFGSNPDRWETDQSQINAWAKTDGSDVLKTEKALDDLLNLVQPPVCAGLTERIQSFVINEALRGQLLIFKRFAPWISLCCLIGGFYLGWYQNHLNNVNTQSYFETMFDTFYEQY